MGPLNDEVTISQINLIQGGHDRCRLICRGKRRSESAGALIQLSSSDSVAALLRTHEQKVLQVEDAVPDTAA